MSMVSGSQSLLFLIRSRLVRRSHQQDLIVPAIKSTHYYQPSPKMIGSEFAIGGSPEGPLLPDYIDRAVFRRPPPDFSVEMLPPIKHAGSFGYRMLISSIYSDSASSVSWVSSASRSSYEIWRRWSDCLMFQNELEVEYSRMARSKKQRLVAGKGVKKNGIYIHDQASSFVSLPNGPDPSSVHLNIHHYLPKLTKKSTLFGASPATVIQRQGEMEALIEHFFSPEAPALLHELRQASNIADFFGFWRRDHNRASDLKRESTAKPRNSASSSVFSSYFSPVIGQDLPPTPRHQPVSRSPSKSSSLSATTLSSSFRRSRRSLSESISSGSSGASSRASAGSDHTSIVVSNESPIVCRHRAEPGSVDRHESRAVSALRTLPESIESDTAINFATTHLSPTRRLNKTPSGPRANNRRGQNFRISPIPTANPPNDPGHVFTNDENSADLTNRISMVSASDYIEQLALLMGNPDGDQSFRNSVATSRTACSADAVHPPSCIDLQESLCDNPKSRPISIPDSLHSHHVGDLTDFEPFVTCDDLSFHESSHSETSFEDDSASKYVRISNFFRPRSGSSTSLSSSSSTSTSTSVTGGASSTQDETRSLTETLASSVVSSPPTSPTSTLAIKAALDDSIVVLRVPRTICFDEVRQRLHDKFVRQEGVPLSESFAIAQLMNNATSRTRSVFAHRRVRSEGAGVSDSIQTWLITSQQEWEQAVRGVTDFEKLNLHIVRNSS